VALVSLYTFMFRWWACNYHAPVINFDGWWKPRIPASWFAFAASFIVHRPANAFIEMFVCFQLVLVLLTATNHLGLASLSLAPTPHYAAQDHYVSNPLILIIFCKIYDACQNTKQIDSCPRSLPFFVSMELFFSFFSKQFSNLIQATWEYRDYCDII
jgi:hypothetical protein